MALDGSGPTRLTDGAEAGLTHRVARLSDDDTPGIDPAASLYLTLYDEKTEERGYARLAGGWGGPAETLVLEDRLVEGLTRADSADVLLHRSQAFDDPPDYFVAGPDLSDAVQVTDVNPFIAEVAWGSAELVDFVSEGGRDLQAVVLYPAGYEAGQAVPTIVYTYEMLSPQDAPLPGPQRARLLQLHGVDPARVRGASARHRVPGARPRGERAGVGAGRGRQGGRHGDHRPGRGRAHRALLGGLSGHLPADPNRHLRGLGGRRARSPISSASWAPSTGIPGCPS